jgi:hypothetical protein
VEIVIALQLLAVPSGVYKVSINPITQSMPHLIVPPLNHDSIDSCLDVFIHVVCAVHKDADLVLLFAICKGYIILYYLLYFVSFVCFYVSLLFILIYAPLAAKQVMLLSGSV